MKFAYMALLLLMAATFVVAANDEEVVDEHHLRRELDGDDEDDDDDECSWDNAHNCDIEFVEASYDSGKDICKAKYYLVEENGGARVGDSYTLKFNADKGADIDVDGATVTCMHVGYDGKTRGDGAGLPPTLKFDTKRKIDAKWDGEDATAKVKKWEKDENLKLIITKDEDECSFDNAENCDIKFTKVTYDSSEEKAEAEYKLKDQDGNTVSTHTVEWHDCDENGDEATCVDNGDGLPQDLEFGTQENIDAEWDDKETKAEVKGWKKGDNLEVIITKPEDEDECSWENAKNCKIEFKVVRYKSDKDKVTLKYKLEDKDSGDALAGTFKVVFNKNKGAVLRKKDDRVVAKLLEYDGDERGTGDGLPKDLVFDKQKHVNAKWDGESTRAKVKAWSYGETLKVTVFDPDED